MATVSQTETLTFELRVNDQATAGLRAAADAAEKFAAAETQVIETVERAGPSVNQLIGRLDKQGQASRALIAETKLLQQAQAALRQDAAQGGARQEELARSIETATARVAAAQAKLDGFRSAAQNAAGAAAAAQPAVGGLGFATAALGGSAAATASQMRQLAPQLNDLFTTISTGGGVMQALLQQGGQITPIFGGIRGTLAAMAAALGPVGIAAAVAGGAMLAVGVSAEGSARRLDTLQQRLRATRDDYAVLAAGAEQSARRVANSSSLSLSDARAAGQAVASSAGFSGVASELEALVRLSADVARGLGVSVADAAGRLAAALDNPRAAARKLADEGFRTMNEGLVRQVELLQLSGQSARAAALVTEAYARGVGGAADQGTALQRALRGLGNAFSEAGTGGKSLADMLGTLVLTPVVAGIETLTGALGKLRGAIDLLKSGNAIEAIRLLDSGTGPIPNGVLPNVPMIIDVPKLLAGLKPGTLMRDGTLQGPPIPGTSERAQGMFQVLPSTAAEMGFTNLADPAQNILAGLTYINRMIAATGSVEGGLARYGGYGNNIGNASGYISKVQSADTSRLPADKAAQIEYWGQVLGLPPDRIELGKRMAMVESGGRQVTGTVQYGPPVATSGNTVAGFGQLDYMGPRDAARASGNYALLPQQDRRTIDSALGGAYDTTGATQTKLRAEIAGNEAALKLLADAGIKTGSVVDALTEKQGMLRGTLATTRTAYGENIHSLDLAAEASTGATGAARTHADALIAAREAAVRMGQETLTASQRLEVHAKVQADLNGQFAETFNAQLRANDQQQRLNDSYAGGARSMIEYQNRITAETEALKTAEEGTSEYREQVDALTAARNRGSAIAADRRTLELGIDQKQQLDELKAEASLIGLSTDARERELAVIKERARIVRDGGDIASAASKASLANVANIAAQASANKQLEASYNDLANVGVNAFQQVGDAIVEAFAQGSKKGIDFGDVMRGVIASVVKQLATLAVINPILNTLFGGNRSTLMSGLDVLFNNVGASAVSMTSAVASAGNGTLNATEATFGYPGSGSSAASSAGAGGAAAGGVGLLSGAKAAFDVGKLILGGGGGQAIGTAIAGALGQTTEQIAATVTNVALSNATSIGGAAVSGVATTADLAAVSSTQLAVASASEAAGVSAGAAASAAATVSQAIPYIGVAVGVISNLAQGNYKGAALVAGGAATGALIGSVVPGIGTAIGAAAGAIVGGLVDMFTGPHKKNAYEAIDVNVDAQGQLARGRVLSQLIDPTKDTATVEALAAGVNDYMAKVGLKLANEAGRVGIVGTGADPKLNNYLNNPMDVFKALRFTAAGDDSSTFSIAKRGALPGQEFTGFEGLQAALTKIATFSDSVDSLGLQLKSVGNDLINLQFSGLKGAAQNDFQTALQNDLPGQTFANVEAFQAEIKKVADFVGTTYPSLLAPVVEKTTELQSQIVATIKTYADAIAQAKAYGLATDGLTTAQAKAIQLLQAPAIQALQLSNLQIVQRGQTARGESTQATQIAAFDIQADQQRTALQDQFKNIWGSLIPDAKEYAAASKALDETLAAERVALVKQTNQQILDAEKQAATALVQAARTAQDASLGVFSQFISIRARQKAASGDERGAEVDTYNLKAIDETKNYSRSLLDYYGQAFAATTDYANRMKELEIVQGAERLAIVKKYNGQLTQAAAQAYAQARSSVLQVIGSLADYSRTLASSASSPLAPQAQYRLALGQFRAVSGAAAAGDFNSLQKLQGYSQTLLDASRAVNGSGTAYAEDYKAVLAALQSAATAPVDKLTDTAMKAATEEQTRALSGKIDELKAELVSVRRELQQQSRAQAA